MDNYTFNKIWKLHDNSWIIDVSIDKTGYKSFSENKDFEIFGQKFSKTGDIFGLLLKKKFENTYAARQWAKKNNVNVIED